MLKRGLFYSLFDVATEGGGGGGGTASSTSLRDSVLTAFAEAEKAAGSATITEEEGEGEGTGTGAEGTGEGTGTTKEGGKEGEGTGEGEEVVEFDASPEEIQSALGLLRSLTNPESAARVVKDLAEAGGYDLTKKADRAALERDTKAILKEKLGDSYDLLGGDKLAEALDSIMQTEVDKRTKPVVDKLTQAELEANQQKANTAMDALWARNKVTDTKVREKVAGQMLAKMQAMPASAKTDINTYLDDIYALVTRDEERARTVKTTVKKIRENATEVSRTSGEGSGADETRVRTGSRLPSIKEAVAAAFRNERLE